MEGAAVAVCEILKYLIIHWTCETGVSKGTLLEGQLMISIETLNSKPQANALRCVTTIASAGCLYSGFILKKFIKEIQSVLPRFSAKKLTWTSEENSCSQHASGLTPFQIIFELHEIDGYLDSLLCTTPIPREVSLKMSEVDEEPRTLIRDCLIIKHFLRKVIVVHPKMRFNFSVEVNGVLSTDVFGVENEPTLNLSNGIALVVNCRRYVSRSNFGTTEAHCDRIHPVLGHPVTLVIPDDVAGMDLLGELTLSPAAALCPSQKVSSNQLSRISSASIFLYGPLGLPLMLSSWKEPTTAVFKDTSYFIDWKKYHLCMVPNLDLDLDKDVMLPDVGYQVGSSQRDQSQNMDPPGRTLLLFLFVDFHSGFPVQQTELWGVHTLLTTHLSTVLRESHSVVQDSIQFTVDQVLGQHQQAVKSQQKLKASLSVAVNSILTIVTGSTDSSFRKTCLQALQAADTQEFGTKLHEVFHEITQHRLPHHGPCDRKQQPSPEGEDSALRTEAARENIRPECFAENKRLKTGVDETRAPSPAAAATRRPEPCAAPAPGAPSPGRGLEEALWLREVSNLSEWLRP